MEGDVEEEEAGRGEERHDAGTEEHRLAHHPFAGEPDHQLDVQPHNHRGRRQARSFVSGRWRIRAPPWVAGELDQGDDREGSWSERITWERMSSL